MNSNGPAQAAGIEAGDLIIRFDGKPIADPNELTQIVADTPIGKEVAVSVIRGGKEGMTTVKLGQRLVLNGAALDAYRQKLGGILQELESLGASAKTWNQSDLQRFSELFAQFEPIKKTVPPDDGVIQKLWGQLEREFTTYKSFADNLARRREVQRAQLADRGVAGELPSLYLNYMTLQVCDERFQQYENVRSGLREFLINKEAAVSRELADQLWNAVAERFQKVESALERAGNDQLFAECEQVSKKAAALIISQTGEQTEEPALRKKDF